MTAHEQPAAWARDGSSKSWALLGSEHHEDSPAHIDFQYEARRYLREVNALVGADAFAAHALACHFGRLAGGAYV